MRFGRIIVAHGPCEDMKDEAQAIAVSERLIQKLTNRMANHLRESTNTDESVKALETLFNVASDE
ncbi:MAG: hypothetical protein EBT93_16955 [Alphaproteobacteria bacterium]|nr:hypothetical protein [Alphaproteobacteria bacterium]